MVCCLIDEYRRKRRDVAAVIIEPIQSEGGDNEASPEFFQLLQGICKKVKFNLFAVAPLSIATPVTENIDPRSCRSGNPCCPFQHRAEVVFGG